MKPKRVLLVEDEFLIAMDLAEELEARDHHVLGPFRAAAEALAAIEDTPIDVALLDVSLHDGECWALADALRARSVTVVFLSGRRESDLPERFRGAPLIGKPVAYDRLLSLLDAA